MAFSTNCVVAHRLRLYERKQEIELSPRNSLRSLRIVSSCSLGLLVPSEIAAWWNRDRCCLLSRESVVFWIKLIHQEEELANGKCNKVLNSLMFLLTFDDNTIAFSILAALWFNLLSGGYH